MISRLLDFAVETLVLNQPRKGDVAPVPSDLLNADGPCECGTCDCNSPLIDPNRKPGRPA